MSHMHARMLRQPELYMLQRMHVMASHQLHPHDGTNAERVRQPRMFDILLCIVCLGLPEKVSFFRTECDSTFCCYV